jgi:hypothetical protein
MKRGKREKKKCIKRKKEDKAEIVVKGTVSRDFGIFNGYT